MSLLTEGTRRALDELGTCLGGIDEDRLGELAELLAREGFARVADAVGADLR